MSSSPAPGQHPSRSRPRSPAPIPKAQPQPQPQPQPKPTATPWVDPAALPRATPAALAFCDAAAIRGRAPARAKQLALNTFAAYGVGADAAAFGHAAGRRVRFTAIDVEDAGGGEGNTDTAKTRMVTVLAEVVVDKSMVNGNGMMHGGCIAYLIDKLRVPPCGSTPLVVLGLLRGRNGVGVTQALNILYHAPAPIADPKFRGTTLEIVSTSLALGGRSMTARCEIFDKSTGRLVASAFINKMEPKL
ncbi:hypothetical protein DFH11DRAFT_1785422 [Phellopilus nigrolimitatus]|nr:hypothetical protein DFH11DRAFT_1785422 [Phellopilus nigrolimitatus]